MKPTAEGAGVEVSARALAAAAALADPAHECQEVWESAARPGHNGDLVITSHCDCGRVVRVTRDTVLPRGHQHWH